MTSSHVMYQSVSLTGCLCVCVGSLPWQGLKAKNPQKKYRLILEKKQQVSIAQLCQGLPSQFAEFLAYSRSLKFDGLRLLSYDLLMIYLCVFSET